MSFSTWLEQTHYTRKKKLSLQKLYDETIALGEDDFNAHNNFCKCFLKDESYTIYKNQRAIFARKDEFKCRVAPIFKCIETELFKLPYFIKKIPVAARPKFIFDLFGDHPAFIDKDTHELRRCLATDYSVYESSFTKEVMEDCEMILYRHMVQSLPEGKRFLNLIERVLMGTNECRFQNVRVKLEAGRMSGEMNTSLGNSFTNLMLYLFAMEEFDCKEAQCLVEGDDGIGSYIGPKIPDSFYTKLGFNIKLVYHKTLNTASFCGQIFEFETFTVICDPIKVLLNFAWSNIKYAFASTKVKLQLLRCKAICLVYQYPGCPIIQAFAMRIVKYTKGSRSRIDGTLDPYKRDEQRQALLAFHGILPCRKITLPTRQLMEKVYGITIVDQLLLELYLSGLHYREPLQHPVLYSYITNVCFQYDKIYTSESYGADLPFVRSGAQRNSFLVSLSELVHTDEFNVGQKQKSKIEVSA